MLYLPTPEKTDWNGNFVKRWHDPEVKIQKQIFNYKINNNFISKHYELGPILIFLHTHFSYIFTYKFSHL